MCLSDWKGKGLKSVPEVDYYFAQMCIEIDDRLNETAVSRWFLNWFDLSPREKMIANLLPEVELALKMNIKNLHIRTLVFSPYRGIELQKDYLDDLKKSIGSKGLLMPLLVNELDNGLYSIIDGRHRFTVCEQLGYESIPCNVLKLTREQQLEMQMMRSVPYVKTSPEEYKQVLRRLIALNPLMTLPELKDKIDQPSEYLLEMLGFNSMNPKVLIKVKDGSIKLSNALTLVELPTHMQGDYSDQAINLQPTDFCPIVLNKVSELKISLGSPLGEQSQGDA